MVGEVEPGYVDAGVAGGGGDVGGCPVAGIGIAHRERDVGARAGQGTCRFDADARGGAGHDRALAAQVDPGNYLCGGRVESERSGNGCHGCRPRVVLGLSFDSSRLPLCFQRLYL